LGTAVGWWTKNRDAIVDEAQEESDALRGELRRRAKARPTDASAAVAPLRTLGGALARARKAGDDERTREIVGALDKLAVSADALKAVKSVPRLVASLSRRAEDATVKAAARALVAKWKRLVAREDAPPKPAADASKPGRLKR